MKIVGARTFAAMTLLNSAFAIIDFIAHVTASVHRLARTQRRLLQAEEPAVHIVMIDFRELDVS
jgi:hypothetical protein